MMAISNWLVAAAMAVVVAPLVGCGVQSPRPAPQVVPPARRAAVARLAPSAAGDCHLQERPTLPPELRFFEEANDVDRLMMVREQSSAGPYRPRRQAIRSEALHSATAFAHRLGASEVFDRTAPGCDYQILSPDGRVCPSAVSPGQPLSAAQLGELIRLLRQAPRKLSTCVRHLMS